MMTELTDTRLNVGIITPLPIPLTIDPLLVFASAGISPSLSPAVIFYLSGKGPGVHTIHSCPVWHSKVILSHGVWGLSAVSGYNIENCWSLLITILGSVWMRECWERAQRTCLRTESERWRFIQSCARQTDRHKDILTLFVHCFLTEQKRWTEPLRIQ